VIADLWQIWNRSDEYSSGMLVPLIAAYILYNSRDSLRSCKIKPCVYAVFVFIAAQVMRWVGLFFMYASAERLSMLITLAALVMLIGGVRLFRKVSPVLLFTLLMLPLPASVHARVTLPLQNVATSSAVFCLELFGFIVTREGNIIRLNDATVAVAEACNGLRMVMAFFVIASFIALLIKRPWPEKMIVVFSALPVAIVCNTIRLTATAMIFMVVDAERWESLFHDFGGYAMMPLAIGMLMAQLWLLKKLFTTDQQPAVAV
jgi:exosortase